MARYDGEDKSPRPVNFQLSNIKINALRHCVCSSKTVTFTLLHRLQVTLSFFCPLVNAHPPGKIQSRGISSSAHVPHS